jgi:hypothetical protein
MEDNGIQSMDVDEENGRQERRDNEKQARAKQRAEEERRAEEEKRGEARKGRGEGFLLKAMKGFDMLREKVRGKMLFRNKEMGEIRVTGEKRDIGGENEERIEIEKVTENEDEIDIEVEVRTERRRGGSERGSLYSGGSGTVEGYGFLGAIEEEG